MPADDELLDLLGRALRPAAVPEPTMRELLALEEAVRYPRDEPARRFRFTPQALAALLGAGILATSGTAFAFEQGHVPDPVRSAAHAVGLPVDTPAAHDAMAAAHRLRQALHQDDDDRVRAAAAALQARVRHLPAVDRRSVAEPLLADARQRLERDRDAAAGRRQDGPPIEDGVNQGTIPARDDRGDGSQGGHDGRADTRGPADGSRSDGRGATTASTTRRPGDGGGGGGGRDSGPSSDHSTTATTTATSSTATVHSSSTDHADDGSGPGHDGLPDLGKWRAGRN